jgi:hypothetical protein
MSDTPSKYEQPGQDPPKPPSLGVLTGAGQSATQIALAQMNIGQAAWQLREQCYIPWTPNPEPLTPYQQPDYRVPSGPVGK